MKFMLWTGVLGLAVGVAGSCLGQVVGKVVLEGTPPAARAIAVTPDCEAAHQGQMPKDEMVVVGKGGELKNVVVSIKDAPPSESKAPSEPAVIDQKGCAYTPHVTAVRVGQKVIVKNSDALLHNVHGFPEDNAGFNFAEISKDPGRPIPAIKVPEIFRIKCDVHPWMGAWVAAFDHPYFALTGEDGTFSIKGLPDGEYNAQAWQERFGTVDGKVAVKDGKGTVNFKFNVEESK